MTDYDKALKAVEGLSHFMLGQEVMTPIGKGIIVSLEMPSNGLYLSPQKATAVVWFSTQTSQNGWVQKEFPLSELEYVNVYHIDVGKLSYDEATKKVEDAVKNLKA